MQVWKAHKGRVGEGPAQGVVPGTGWEVSREPPEGRAEGPARKGREEPKAVLVWLQGQESTGLGRGPAVDSEV